MFRAEICLNNDNSYVSGGYSASLRFHNQKRFETFCFYFSKKYHCMIRLFHGGWWYETVLDGRDIWNDF